MIYPTPKTILDENYCVCILRNATTLFVFWKFSDYYLSLFENKSISPYIRLKLINEDEKILVDIPCLYSKSLIHIGLPANARRARVEIYCNENNNQKLLCVSNEVLLASERDIKGDYNFYNEKN